MAYNLINLDRNPKIPAIYSKTPKLSVNNTYTPAQQYLNSVNTTISNDKK